MKLVLVAYRFPPVRGGGVIRAQKFAKYLARLGVEVTVVTSQIAQSDTDESALLDIPSSVKVLRLKDRGPIRHLRRISRRHPTLLSWAARQKRAWRLGRNLLTKHTSVPDVYRGFIDAATEVLGDPAIHGADVVLATGGPFSSFLAGERIAAALEVPLVLDYRDPWTHSKRFRANVGWLSRRVSPRMERQLLGVASLVLVAHEFMLDELRSAAARNGHAPPLMEMLPNGFDPEDFQNLESVRPDRFVITFAGSLYSGRSLEPIAGALEAAIASGDIAEDDVVLRVLGTDPRRVHEQVASPRILKHTDAMGVVPHREALRHLTQSAMNVLVDIEYPGPNLHTAGKVYEYLRAERPILCYVNEGVTPQLVRDAGAGWTVTPGDHAGTREALCAAYREWKSGEGRTFQRHVVQRFDRSKTAVRLRDLLEETVARANPRRKGA